MIELLKAVHANHFADAAQLIREYHIYISRMKFEECIAGDMEAEIVALSQVYPASEGGVFVAYASDAPAGCVALEKQADGIAEIRRLYVKDSARGLGLGKKLIARAVSEAQDLQYKAVRLDTFREVDFAGKIYRELGFKEIPPYSALPPERIIFMEQTL